MFWRLGSTERLVSHTRWSSCACHWDNGWLGCHVGTVDVCSSLCVCVFYSLVPCMARRCGSFVIMHSNLDLLLSVSQSVIQPSHEVFKYIMASMLLVSTGFSSLVESSSRSLRQPLWEHTVHRRGCLTAWLLTKWLSTMAMFPVPLSLVFYTWLSSKRDYGLLRGTAMEDYRIESA